MTHTPIQHFDWHQEQEKAMKKAIYRAIHQCRCNPDYILKHPSEAKQNPDHKILDKLNPEAVKRITLDLSKRQHFYDTPTITRPTRKNRN